MAHPVQSGRVLNVGEACDYGLDQAFTYIEHLVEKTMRDGAIPGMTLAVTDRERTLRVFASGFSDIASKAPVAPETAFEIGSLGKAVYRDPAASTVRSREARPHAPVSRYLPWFEVQSSLEPITLHHLLNHTSGINRGTDIAPHGLYESWAMRDIRNELGARGILLVLKPRVQDAGFHAGALYGQSLPADHRFACAAAAGNEHTLTRDQPGDQ